jgi:hypothetical protein
MRGRLEQVSLWALLQVLARQDRASHVALYSENGQEAHLWIDRGALVDAHFRGAEDGERGEEVVHRLLSWHDGYFFVRPEVSPSAGRPVEVLAILTRAALRQGLSARSSADSSAAEPGSPPQALS